MDAVTASSDSLGAFDPVVPPMAPQASRVAASEKAANPVAAAPPPAPNRPTPRQPSQEVADGIASLPPYLRSRLKVKVPVRVTIASTKLPLQRILDLSPGTILQFNKPCDEPLTLEVGEQVVALGEAVKVGDQFGLSIQSISLPAERFWVVGKKPGAVRAK